jgi:hypothetical protein
MKGEIKGIFEDDLQQFLKSIGELSEIRAGKVKCKNCGNIITIENLAIVYPDSGDIKYICNNPECVKAYM